VGRLEILSAFVGRTVVDEITEDLRVSGFLPVALESGAFSVARLIRDKMNGFDPAKAYLVLNLRSGGMDFLILRKGMLHFEYFVSWHDIQANEKKIPLPLFQDAIIRNVRQVLNFYGQHWQEPLSDMLIAGGELSDEITRTVQANFPLTPHRPELAIGGDVLGEWFPALGVGLRALVARRQDKDINLLSPDAQQEFQEQHLLSFLRFWRIMIPLSLLMLAAALFGGNWFLNQKKDELNLQLAGGGVRTVGEAATLQAKVQKFNDSIRAIASIREDFKPKFTLLKKINALTAAGGVNLTRFSFNGFGQMARIDGEAKSVAAVMIGVEQNLDLVVVWKVRIAHQVTSVNLRGIRIKRANAEVDVFVVKKHAHFGALSGGSAFDGSLLKKISRRLGKRPGGFV